MPIPVSEPEAKFTPAPEGLHLAVCVDVVDRGLVEGKFGLKHEVQIWWQLEARNPETGDRFTVRKNYTASLHEKANLAKDLTLWRGKAFTTDERKYFDLERLLGASCQLQIVHATKEDGRTFANVAAVFSSGGKKLVAEAYVREQARVAAPPAQAVPEDDDIPF